MELGPFLIGPYGTADIFASAITLMVLILIFTLYLSNGPFKRSYANAGFIREALLTLFIIILVTIAIIMLALTAMVLGKIAVYMLLPFAALLSVMSH